MEPKRVLIVEPDHAFGLSLASLFKEDGCSTAVALSAAEAELEIATRRPHLVVSRAELPQLSGFSLCAQLRHDPTTAELPFLLYSSDTPPESLAEHARTPWAANGYLAMPLDTDALRVLAKSLLAKSEVVENADDAILPPDAEDSTYPSVAAQTEDTALGQVASSEAEGSVSRRPVRSVLRDEDRLFLERVFQSVADHKDELVRESMARRPPPRRDLLGTPEGRVEALRIDLKWREAQIARISEIWGIRERELASFDDRIHEKDVDLQALKLQVDDLSSRLLDARDVFVEKEQEYGASIDGLLLEKFSQEKQLIEVVAANERRIHELERELRKKDDELASRKVALAEAEAEVSELDRRVGATEERLDARERELTEELGKRAAEVSAAEEALTLARRAGEDASREAARTLKEAAATRRALEAELGETRAERDAVKEAKASALAQASSREKSLEAELNKVRSEAEKARLLSEATAEKAGSTLAELESAKERNASVSREAQQSLQARIDERESAIKEREQRLRLLDEEYRRYRETARAREVDLSREVQDHLQQIGALEAELEDLETELAERNESSTGPAGLRAAEGNLKEAQERATAAEARAAELEKTSKEALRDLSDERARAKKLEAEFEQMKKARTMAESAVRERDALSVALLEHDARAESMAAEAVRKQTLKLEQELAAERAAGKEWRTHTQSLEDSQVLARDEVGRLTARIEELQKASGESEEARRSHEDQAREEAALLVSEVERARDESLTSLREAQAMGEALEAAKQLLLKREAEWSVERAARQERTAKAEESAALNSAKVENSEQVALSTREALEALSRESERRRRLFEEREGELANDLGLAQQELEKLRGELSSLRDGGLAREEELGRDLESAKSRADEITERLAKTSAEMDLYRTREAAQRAEVEKKNAEVLALSDEAKRALAARNEAEERRRSLEAALTAEIEARAEALEEARAEVERTSVVSADREEELLREFTRKNEASEELHRRFDELVSERAKREESLHRELMEKKEALDAAERRQRAAEEALGALERELMERVGAAEEEAKRGARERKEEAGAAESERRTSALESARAAAFGRAGKAERRVTELEEALAKAHRDRQRIETELLARVQRAEARAAEMPSKSEPVETGEDVLAKAKARIRELEGVLASAGEARARGERELLARTHLAEERAAEFGRRIERLEAKGREAELTVSRFVEEAEGRFREELTRREELRTAELERLSSALKERARREKALELELERLRGAGKGESKETANAGAGHGE